MYIVIVVKSIYIRIHKILVLHNHNLCQFVDYHQSLHTLVRPAVSLTKEGAASR